MTRRKVREGRRHKIGGLIGNPLSTINCSIPRANLLPRVAATNLLNRAILHIETLETPGNTTTLKHMNGKIQERKDKRGACNRTAAHVLFPQPHAHERRGNGSRRGSRPELCLNLLGISQICCNGLDFINFCIACRIRKRRANGCCNILFVAGRQTSGSNSIPQPCCISLCGSIDGETRPSLWLRKA